MESYLAIISDTVWFTPLLFVIVAMTALMWELIRQKSHVPSYGSAPRPPGESLRLDLNVMNEKLILRLILTVGIAVFTGIAARVVASSSNYPLVHAIMFTGSGLALAFTLWTWRLLTRWRNSQLGFYDKRRVGRTLDLLMLDGCRVFHDLVDQRIGHLDHIIVAPHAIFAVETSPRQIPEADSGANWNRVIYSGQELRFPGFTTNKPLKQVAGKAKWLEQYFGRTTGIQLPVHPIVVLPGWTVESTGKGPVTVVNPKEINSVVVDRAATAIYDAQRNPIIDLLDKKCRSTAA